MRSTLSSRLQLSYHLPGFAKVWTGEDAHPLAEAFAVRGDHLVAVGTNAEIRALATAETAESRKGTLAAGKLADFVVLSEDIFSAPPDRILKTKVLLTVMGGRETHRAAIFP